MAFLGTVKSHFCPSSAWTWTIPATCLTTFSSGRIEVRTASSTTSRRSRSTWKKKKMIQIILSHLWDLSNCFLYQIILALENCEYRLPNIIHSWPFTSPFFFFVFQLQLGTVVLVIQVDEIRTDDHHNVSNGILGNVVSFGSLFEHYVSFDWILGILKLRFGLFAITLESNDLPMERITNVFNVGNPLCPVAEVGRHRLLPALKKSRPNSFRIVRDVTSTTTDISSGTFRNGNRNCLNRLENFGDFCVDRIDVILTTLNDGLEAAAVDRWRRRVLNASRRLDVVTIHLVPKVILFEVMKRRFLLWQRFCWDVACNALYESTKPIKTCSVVFGRIILTWLLTSQNDLLFNSCRLILSTNVTRHRWWRWFTVLSFEWRSNLTNAVAHIVVSNVLQSVNIAFDILIYRRRHRRRYVRRHCLKCRLLTCRRRL